MQLFKKNQPPKNEYLKKYIAMATRFQNIGIVIILIAILLNCLSHNATIDTLSLIVFVIGAIPLVFGGSSLRPHNLIKAFAQQCSNQPDYLMAEGLLEAMERNRNTGLTKNSIRIVEMAIEVYSSQEDADPELVAKLQHTAKSNLSRKVF